MGVVVGMMVAPVSAQVPRTHWGDPDLQGIYTTDAERSVPMERPAEFGDRAELRAEEFAARADDEARAARDDRDGSGGPRGDTGPRHWFEFTDQPSARTSLIVEPPDGRIPPLTLGAQTRAIDPNSILGFVGGAFDGGPLDGPEDGLVQNLFRVGRHLFRAVHHRTLRTRSFRVWDEVTWAY